MKRNITPELDPIHENHYPESRIRQRRRRGFIWQSVFLLSTSVAILALVILLLNIVNGAFGYVAVENAVNPDELAVDGTPLSGLSEAQLIGIMEERLSRGLVRRFNFEKPLDERSRTELLDIIEERIVDSHVVRSWTLGESLFRKDLMREFLAENPAASLTFRSWVNLGFIVNSQSSVPEDAGIRTAILGSLWIIFITILFAFPVGVGAAIYLEEYAGQNRLNRIIQVNIYNLSGVPSIVYGLLGLAVFVRFLGPLTSGVVFGFSEQTTSNGRTILSAGLTLALLILPIIIINAQEAIRAVPKSLRDSSYGVGATQWQTIRHHVLPASFDRILTGTILAVSRAVGETAPLVVVGASTFVAIDPDSVFSKFTALPIQVYQWSSRPQAEFRNIAAAAIIVLLVLLLSTNGFAIYLRNRLSRNRSYE